MGYAADPRSNRLLAALMDADRQRWRKNLERVDLRAGQVLHEPGRPQTHAYFPSSAIVSLSYVLETGGSAEVALVGHEGVVGTPVLLDVGTSTTHSTVVIAGQGFRIGAPVVKDLFERSDAVRTLFLRYIQALSTQMTLTAACNRHHTIDQQVCSWLLHCLDRLRGSEIVVTHELLGNMLGVRRESVTQVACQLQDSGLIRYARGHIEVLDRRALERRACECHAVVLKECERLLPHEHPARAAAPRRWPRPTSESVSVAAA
jgi:CRP-like cAMP-binding protein